MYREKRSWLVKIILTTLLILIAIPTSDYIVRIAFPDLSRDVVVAQLEDSDEAYDELQIHDIAKEYAVLIEMAMVFCGLLFIWDGHKYVYRLIKIGVQRCSGNS